MPWRPGAGWCRDRLGVWSAGVVHLRAAGARRVLRSGGEGEADMVAILHVPMLRRDPRVVCQTVKPLFGRWAGPRWTQRLILGVLGIV
jgi:hypothetical protein